MKRTPAKKGTERRKKSRAGQAPASNRRSVAAPKGAAKKEAKQPAPDACHSCGKGLSQDNERALFVEEEIGRIFCSENCIAEYFTPEIERLEKEYFRRLSANDLTGEEKESLAHLRWITLQEPDEVWREKTLTGDHRYTLISEFQPNDKKVWSVCICLFLRGEPSFLYLAFTTRSAAMVNHYRRGEQVEWVRPQRSSRQDSEAGAGVNAAEQYGDRLADAWTEDETFLAQMSFERGPSDIPVQDFPLYHACLEETLEEPGEVWSTHGGRGGSRRVYHFIRHYPDEKPGVWYLVIARETEDEEQLEILDAFPTRDRSLMERYRRGEQEVGKESSSPASVRVVH